MKKKIINIFKTLIFLTVGIILFWLVYRKQDFSQIWIELKQARWGWLIFSMILGILSHISRVIRWKLMIEPLGYKARGTILFFSVMIMYLTNLAIPRSGEVVRCATTSKYEKIPFSSLLGTVVTERIIDMLMMIIFLILAIVIQFSYLFRFWKQNPQLHDILFVLSKYLPFLIISAIIGIAFIVILITYRKKLKTTKLFGKFYQILENFGQGIISVLHMKKKWQFIAHSIFIWTMYFLMMYVIFFAFDFTENIPLMAGFVIFVMSTLGMVFPSPGGMGSWDFMTIEGLKLYGIAQNNAAIYALITHASQIFLLISFGLLSLVAISFFKPIKKI